MVKKTLFCLWIVLLLIGWGYTVNNSRKEPVFQPEEQSVSPSPSVARPRKSTAVFVPYWASGAVEDVSVYDSFYYFGIEPTKEGEIKDASSEKRIELMKNIPSKKRRVVLRMLNSEIYTAILSNVSTQKKLAKELNTFLDMNTYDGVVIDLEVSFTLRDKTQNQITQFVQTLCTEIQDNYKSCSMLIYGDLFYRKRPYDLKKLGAIVDTIHIMAYDFHKAGGEPGPNFPFENAEYDFQQMIDDFTASVPEEKLEVVFGMYGYDWTLNEQGTPLKAGTAISLGEIEGTLGRQYPIKKNSSREKSIEYTDENGKRHVVWYEDRESVKVKTEYLLRRGIGQVSFWAYSYFK